MRFPVKIEDADMCKTIRDAVGKLLSNTVPHLSLPQSLHLDMHRHQNHIEVEWTGKVEAVIPGPDPDLIRARLYRTHAEIDARISGLRVSYE